MKKVTYIIIGVALCIIALIGVARWRVMSVSNGHIFDSESVEQLSNCQDVVVLGAGVTDDGNMSPVLEERAITAKDLYDKDKACRVIVTGYEGEVKPVGQYLIENNVPRNIVMLDGKGIDTITSMKNMHDVYDVQKAIIVTQDFHLSRAVYLARMHDVDASGYVAYKYYPYIMLEEYKYIIRDWLASVKAAWQVELMKN
ncbi:MAG: YdcF family protein [Patescibacteria group bacterium]|nr:YdcF family protein [Patescibacteria group bacterium]